MRYYLMQFQDRYYIISKNDKKLLSKCLQLVAKPIASIHCRYEDIAVKILTLHALVHSLSTTDSVPLKPPL